MFFYKLSKCVKRVFSPHINLHFPFVKKCSVILQNIIQNYA